jgi:branched-chain amino acid transport system permease protein
MADKASVPLRVPQRYGPVREFLGLAPASVAGAAGLMVVPAVTSAYWTFNVMVGLVLAISCLGLLVLAGWAREISLMQAGLTGSALYLSMYVYRDSVYGNGLGSPFVLAVAFGIGFTALLSLITALVAVRLAGVYVTVLTLSVQFWLEYSVMLEEQLTGGLAIPTDRRPHLFGFDLRSDARYYYLLLAGLGVVVVFLHRARYSRFGRSMILVGADPVAAAAAGVSPWRYRAWAFAVAGALAGLAGALSGPLYLSPPGTLQYISINSIAYLSVPLLAGFDSISGTVAVAVVLTLLPQVVLEWELNVYLLGGIGMAVGCLLGPRGLGGLLSDRMRS